MQSDQLLESSLVDKVETDKFVAVVCCADDDYSMPLAVMARSILENLHKDHQLLFFIIDGGIRNYNRLKILASLHSSQCEVQFISKPSFLSDQVVDSLQQSATRTKHILSKSGAAYYRLFLSELLPHNLEKVIYLDCDLVVRGDLTQIWNVDIGDNYVLGIQELWTPFLSTGLATYRELDFPQEAKYFNSGVLVINLKRWRDDQILDKFLNYIEKYKNSLIHHDQDVLNAVLVESWGELDHRWNVTPAIYHYLSWQDSPVSEETFNQLINDPYIIHYATSAKPWAVAKTGFKESFPFNDVFFHYLDYTVWSGWRLTFWRLLWLKLKRKLKQGCFILIKPFLCRAYELLLQPASQG